MKKKIFITGSTDGIGKLAATELAKEGHAVILHGRNSEKLESVLTEVQEATGNTEITGYTADLSDLNAVHEMTQKIKQDFLQLDVLINNAGVFLSKSPRLENGMDLRLVVNYLAPVLLTEELLPILRVAGTPRVISLSSAAQAPVSIEALKGQRNLSDQDAYAQSKLALLMWSFDMASRNKDLTFIAVNPGSLLNTKMVQEAYGKHWAPADKGADILVELATGVEHAEMSGEYFDNDRGGYGPAHPDAYVEGKISELIETTNTLLKAK